MGYRCPRSVYFIYSVCITHTLVQFPPLPCFIYFHSETVDTKHKNLIQSFTQSLSKDICNKNSRNKKQKNKSFFFLLGKLQLGENGIILQDHIAYKQEGNIRKILFPEENCQSTEKDGWFAKCVCNVSIVCGISQLLASLKEFIT